MLFSLPFLRNILENELQAIKMTRQTLILGLVLSIKYTVTYETTHTHAHTI